MTSMSFVSVETPRQGTLTEYEVQGTKYKVQTRGKRRFRGVLRPRTSRKHVLAPSHPCVGVQAFHGPSKTRA